MAREGRPTLFDGYDLGEDRYDDEFGGISSQEYQEQQRVYFSQDYPYGTQDEQGGEDMADDEVIGMTEDQPRDILYGEVATPGDGHIEETQQFPATPLPGSPNETRQRGYNRHGRNGTYKCPACRKNHKLVTLHLVILRSRLMYVSASLLILTTDVIFVYRRSSFADRKF
jgi:hypothetical protein